MRFTVPNSTIEFDIDDAWWGFVEMDKWERISTYYPYQHLERDEVEVVPMSEVEPPARSVGVPLLRKSGIVSVLFGFQHPDCRLPAVAVTRLSQGPYRFRVLDGTHRFYASIAVGFTDLPVLIHRQVL